MYLGQYCPKENLMKITIRPANEEHITGIYSLVKELAAYENASSEVTLSLDQYKFFFASRRFEAFVSLDADKVVGACIYYDAFSTWKGPMLYLEDFVVAEPYRGHGVGQQLFDYLIKLAKSGDYSLIKWQVLDWNIPAIKFYEKNNAIIEKEWWNGKIYL